MKKILIIVIKISFIVSCEKSNNFPTYDNMDVTTGFVLNNAIIISEGDCAGDFETNTYICLVSVLNDSRCPEGVQCFWQGNAEAKFKFTKPDEILLFLT